MPEDPKTGSSGGPPEEATPKVLFPSGPPGPPKEPTPRIFADTSTPHGAGDGEARPAVMTFPDTHPTPRAEGAPKPKVFVDTPGTPEGVPEPVDELRGPSVLFGTPIADRPRGDGPKVLLDATVRTRVPCRASDLALLQVGVSEEVIERALRIIETTNLDDEYVEDLVRLGGELQASHGRLAEEELALAHDPDLTEGQTLLAGILQTLGELDPERVFQMKEDPVSGFLRLIRRAPSAHALFEEKYPKMRESIGRLRALKERLEQVAKRFAAYKSHYAELTAGVESFVLALTYLAAWARDKRTQDGSPDGHYARQAETIDLRATSLLATRTTLRMGVLTLGVLESGVDALLSSARGMLEVELPLWHTSYTAALAAARTDGARESAPLEALRASHARMVQKLKGEY